MAHDQPQTSAATDLVPWKYCNPYANNRSPERLFTFQGETILIRQRLDEKVTIDQNTGNVVWDGAYLTAKYLETFLAHDIRGKTCLELGAGTGLVSIVAWLLGASFVLATDLPGPHSEHVSMNAVTNTPGLEEERCRLIQESQALEAKNDAQSRWQRKVNKKRLYPLVKSNLHVEPLDWTNPELPESTPFRGPFSFIFCSEILYLPQLHRALLKTITRFSDESTIVVLLWKQRGLGEERFFDIAGRPSSGWTVDHLDKTVLDPEFQEQPYCIAQMRRSATQ